MNKKRKKNGEVSEACPVCDALRDGKKIPKKDLKKVFHPKKRPETLVVEELLEEDLEGEEE